MRRDIAVCQLCRSQKDKDNESRTNHLVQLSPICRMGEAHHSHLHGDLSVPEGDGEFCPGRCRSDAGVAGADSGCRDAWQSVASGHVLVAARQLQSCVFQHAHALVHRRLPGTRLGAAAVHRVLHVLRGGRGSDHHRCLLYPFPGDESENWNSGRIWRNFRSADGLWDSLRGSGNVLFPLPFRIKAKYLVGIWVVVAIIAVFEPSQGGVAVFAHLGGLLFGYLWVKFMPSRGMSYVASERYFGVRNSYY